MKTYLYILFFLFLLSILLTAQEQITVNSTNAPRFVQNDKEYKVASKIFLPAETEQIELYLHTDLNTALKNVEFKNPEIKKRLRFFRIEGKSSLDKIYKIESNKITNLKSGIGQVLFTLISQNTNTAKTLVKSEKENLLFDFEDEGIEYIKIYNQNDAAGKCLKMEDHSEIMIDFELQKFEYENVLVEFWAQLDVDSTTYFSINDQMGNKLTSLSKNHYGYIITTALLDADYFDETFIDNNSWNYYLIEFNKNSGRTKIYINDDLYYSGQINDLTNYNNIQTSLSNYSADGFVKVDRLKVWSFGNNEILALANKNYNYYNADSSAIVFLNNFNSRNSITELSKTGKVTLENSNAPIFSRAPVLRALVQEQSFQLNWEISEFTKARSFVVEKSYNGKDFNTVTTLQQIDDSKTDFVTTDFDLSENHIIYYRVKQINEDKSEIYSSTVKVGRGKQTHFHVNQNYPNPFNPVTTVAIDVKKSAKFSIKVYDLVGNVITILHEGNLNEGTHRFDFNGADLPSGLYFCEVKSQDDLEVMKMILAK